MEWNNPPSTVQCLHNYNCLQDLDPTFVVDFNALNIENFNTGEIAEPDVEDVCTPEGMKTLFPIFENSCFYKTRVSCKYINFFGAR